MSTIENRSAERNADKLYDELTVGYRDSILWRALYLTELENASTCWPMEHERTKALQIMRELLTVRHKQS